MRSKRALLFALIAAFTALTSRAVAGVPIQISYQGLLTNSGGAPVTGTHTLTFRLLDVQTGGTALWTEVQTGVTVTGGLFTVALGSITPLNSDVLAPAGSGGTTTSIERYLEVQVDADPPLVPRTRLIAAPYAVAAARIAGDMETQPGELKVSNPSGTKVDHTKASDASAGRSIQINGVEANTQQSDDDSSWTNLSSQRFGRPAINTARAVSGGLGALVSVTGDDDGNGTAERGLIAGTTSIAGPPPTALRGWNFGIDKKMRFQLSATDSNSAFDLDVKPNPQATRDNHLQGACDVITALMRCSTDNDGDGVPENTVTQSSDGAGSRLAIKTKGTGAQRQTATLDAVADSGVTFDLISDNGAGSRSGSQHHYVNLRQSISSLASDTDGDGIADHTVTTTTDDTASSVVLTSAFHNGPRQTVSQDGTFSHGRSRCATDSDNDGNPDFIAENYSDSATARMIVVKHTLTPHDAKLQVDDAGPSLSFHQTGILRLWASPDSGLQVYDPAGAKKWYADANGNVYGDGMLKVGTTSGAHHIDVAGGAYCDGTNWVNASDANSKENFVPVDQRELLNKVAALPISRWNYKVDPAKVQHIGPTAQDFHAAFGVGNDNRSISTIDPSGIALAAIQALNQKLTEQLGKQAAENQDLREQIAQLRELIQAQGIKLK